VHVTDWNDERIERWILHECWLYREKTPGGPGLSLGKDNLKVGSPPLEQIAEGMESLKAKKMVQGEAIWVMGSGSDVLSHIIHLKLTQHGVGTMTKKTAAQ
jgi:hypothetical protein